jgi:hypothetical protein
VRRGPYEIACNFGSGPVRIPCGGGAIELTAGDEAQISDGILTLPAMTGALIR